MTQQAAPVATETAAPVVASPSVATTPSAPTGQVLQSDSSWRASLPTELQSDATLSKFQSPTDLAKSYVELEKFRGNHLPKPSDGWTDKEWNGLYDSIGRPKDAAGYEFKKPDNAPEGLPYNEQMDKWYAEASHKAGLTKAQATALRNAHMELSVEQFGQQAVQSKAQQEASEKALVNLKAQYGQEWAHSVAAGDKVINQLGGEKFADYVKSNGLAKSPEFIQFMINVGKTLQDHSIVTGSPRLGGTFANDPAQAKAEIQRMKSDPEIAKSMATYGHPQQEANWKKMQQLTSIAYPAN